MVHVSMDVESPFMGWKYWYMSSSRPNEWHHDAVSRPARNTPIRIVGKWATRVGGGEEAAAG